MQGPVSNQHIREIAGRPDAMQFSDALPSNAPAQGQLNQGRLPAEDDAVRRMEEIMLSLGSESVSHVDMDMQPQNQEPDRRESDKT